MKDSTTGQTPLLSLEVLLALVTLVLAGLGLGLYWKLSGLKLPRGHVHYREAWSDLKALYTTQRAWFQETDRYDEDLARIGFNPERGNRYTTFMVPVGRVQRRDSAAPVEEGPYSIVSADRQAWPDHVSPVSFYMTGCPLTRVVTPDGRKLGLGVWVFKEGLPVFLAASAANLDEDPQLDCWSVSSADRVSAAGEPIAAGEPFLEASDL
jgi:type IV pilus assembly protein PilA